MKLHSTIFLLTGFLLFSGCTQKIESNTQLETRPTEAEIRAADEASLLATAREAGVSDADALAAKAEIDQIYDDTAAKMDQAEAERIARDKAFKDEACVANCSDQ
jgi:hypothetical protein